MIPTESDIDMNQWLYYAEALKIGWMNPNEEGNQGADVANSAKEIDMSLVSDIQKYIELANYVEQRCGNSIGVTKEMEGRINQYQAVRNTEQALTQGNYIVEPYFDFHNIVKRNALTALVNLAKVIYSNNDVEVLNYVLDDFSKQIIKLDKELLNFSHYGLYVTNSLDTVRVKESIENLALTAMQNQTIEMSDVVKVLKTDNITSAEELLLAAEDKKRKEKSALIQQESQARIQEAQQEQDFKREEWQHEKDLAVLKEEERRETVLQQQAILAMGFDEDKDRNKNDVPDVLEVAKLGIEANLKEREQTRKEKELEHKIEDDKEKNKIARKSAEQKPVKKTK